MQEAFSVLYKLSPDLYTEGSPVVIAAGQLLKDNNTGTILGQLKLKNIGNKPVSAVTVCFVPLDPAARPAGGPFEFRYMDLDCVRDGFCASRKAVPFPDLAARSFSVSVKEVIFSDGSVFALPENAVWESLPAPVKRESFTNKYAEMGFISCFPESAAYKTEKVLDLWYCGCGAINRAEEKACHLCQKEYKSFFDPESEFKQAGKYVQAEEYLSGSDPDKLKKAVSRFKKLGNYLDAPKRAEEAEAKLKKVLKKKKIISCISVILCIAAFAALYLLVLKDMFAYNLACSLLDNGNYEEAKAAYIVLGAYKDSAEQIKECDYRTAKILFKDGKYEEAAATFTALGTYKDSEDQIAVCIQARDYYAAKDLLESGKYEEAKATFIALGAYKDSADMPIECDYQAAKALFDSGKYEEAKTAFIALETYKDSADMPIECDYQVAKALFDSGKYAEAKAAFTVLGTYKDSADMPIECDYRAAKALLDNGKFEEAKATFTALGMYKDSADMVKECDYQEAKALLEKKDYAGVAAIIIHLKGYKDVDTLLASDKNLKAAAALDAAWQPGKYVTFGRYEQDNNKGNGAEAIEWRVLVREGSKALILSKYGLDAKPYNEKYADITWEKSMLRAWLNGEFLNTAFDGTEQARIQQTAVDNGKAQGYSKWNTNGGNDTQDKVFLLSYAEAYKYLGVTYEYSENTEARVSPTAYAKANGADTLSSYKTAEGAYAGWWWLRSPGNLRDSASSVSYDGSLSRNGVNRGGAVVRPALWVEIS